MPENGDPSGRGNTRVQEFEALGAEFGLKHGHPCDVSARSGEARDVAGPYWICMADEDDGNRGCGRFQGPREEGAPRCDEVRLEPDQVRRDFGEPSVGALDPPVLDQEIHALVQAAFPQSRPEGLPQMSLVGVRGFVPQDANAVHLPGLLPLGDDRNGEEAARDSAEEGPPMHYWMTSSARPSSDGGIVRPSAFAVFRLMTRSNFVGCSMGRSPGLAPLRILSTKYAARRDTSGRLAPYDMRQPASVSSRA